ncbi:HD domain-containing protein [Methanosphaera sp.]
MSNIDKLINEVYEELECSEYIINHSNTVYERTHDITKYYDNLDEDLIKAGAKLHDVGRTVTSGIKHAYIGADLLRDLNIDERICKITERHIGAGIIPEEAAKLGLPCRNYIPETLEEKIVAHADNLVHGIKFVDLDFVIKKWTDKGMDTDSIDRLIKLHNELMK